MECSFSTPAAKRCSRQHSRHLLPPYAREPGLHLARQTRRAIVVVKFRESGGGHVVAPSPPILEHGLGDEPHHRARLSAAECALLLGASGQSVYNWEQGKARPQAKHLAAIAEEKRG